MGRRGERHRAIRPCEGAQLVPGRAAQPFVARVVEHVGQGPALDVRAHPRIDRGEAGRAGPRLDAGAGDSRAFEQLRERTTLPEHERGAQRIGDLRSEETLEQVDHGGVAGRGAGRVPDGDREPPAGAEHPPHLGEGGEAVLEEHQREAAGDRVELGVPERQGLRPALAPIDPGRGGAGDRQHSGVPVEPDRPTAAADPGRQGAGDDAGAAGDVERRLARPGPRRGSDRFGELGEQRGHEEGLVGLGGRGRDLAGCGGVHGGPPLLRTGLTG
jgi:hypothetical protein